MDKKYFEKRLKELETTFNNIKPLYRDLTDHFLPRQARFLVQDVNKPPTSSKKIKDSFPVLAARNFSSGMMSGATSPSRKWFKLSINNYGQQDDYAVKAWCATVSTLFRDIFSASNFYQNLPNVYKQLGIFGISVLSLERDFDTVLRTRLLPIGSYRIAKDSKGKVNTLYRVYTETAANLAEKFGEENLSDTAKSALDSNPETPIEIVHAVEPNKRHNKNSPWAKDRKYISVYFERGGDNDKFLSRGGFNKFPYLVFEADVNGEDVYPSDCPGIIALPDVKQLMSMVVEKGKIVKKIGSPPQKGPASIKGKKLSDNPGAFNPEDEKTGRGLSPVYEINPAAINPIREDISETKANINEIFYNDLLKAITSTAQRQRTALEVSEIKEEAMVLLSPLLEQIHDALKDLTDWTFETCLEVGIIPEPPEQIQGADIKIEFVSTLAQAMKAANIGAMERFLTFVTNITATLDPSARMKVNVNEVIDDYADIVNIEPDEVVPTAIVEQQKAIIAQKEAQQQALASVQQGSEIVKNMGGADASGGNLMERIGLA